MLKKVGNLKKVAVEMDFYEALDCESEHAIDKVANFWMEKCIYEWQQLKEILEKCEEFEAVGDVKLLEQYNRKGTYTIKHFEYNFISHLNFFADAPMNVNNLQKALFELSNWKQFCHHFRLRSDFNWRKVLKNFEHSRPWAEIAVTLFKKKKKMDHLFEYMKSPKGKS